MWKFVRHGVQPRFISVLVDADVGQDLSDKYMEMDDFSKTDRGEKTIGEGWYRRDLLSAGTGRPGPSDRKLECSRYEILNYKKFSIFIKRKHKQNHYENMEFFSHLQLLVRCWQEKTN